MNDQSVRGSSGASIAVVGLGNIGSQTTAIIPGIEAIARVLLIDFDRYEANQTIARAAGRYKVDVQAKVLRTVAPHLIVETLVQRVESLPLGLLRGHVIVACVDSRIARQSINRIAFALGTPWVDAALDRGGQVRACTYWPGVGPCLECAWGPLDYELLEQRVPCAGSDAGRATPIVKATAAPQELGAIAAGLQVSQLRSLLSNDNMDASALGRQWFFDIPSGRGWIGTYTANPACRLDHNHWQIIELARSASDLTLSEALRLPGGDCAERGIFLEGQMFVTRLRCVHCGTSRRTAGRLSGRIRARRCRKCGAVMTASAADATDVLSVRNAPPPWLDAPLSAFGLVDADVFSVRSQDGTTHYQLCGTRQEAN